MKQSIAWHIGPDGKPSRLQPGAIDLEKNLENWLTDDIDIIATDILVISRQATTDWGARLDILALDKEGNLVIVELKREQTLRDTVAQAIEYAAWSSTQSYDDIRALAGKHFRNDQLLDERFEERFGVELPETLNQSQRILVVAPNIDDVTETVINYLADVFKVPINAVSFDVFGAPGNQTLVRHFVREPSDVPVLPGSKKRPTRTLEQLRDLAAKNGVLEIVDHFLTLADVLPSIATYYFTFNLRAKVGNRVLAGLSVYPTAETRAGAAEILIGWPNLRDLFNLDPAAIEASVAQTEALAEKLPYNWAGWSRLAVTTTQQAAQITTLLRNLITSGETHA